MIKNDPLDAALTGTDVVGLPPEKDVCFRLTVTRAKTTGPPSDLVCAKTAATPVDTDAGPDADPAPTAPGHDGCTHAGADAHHVGAVAHPDVQPG